MELRSKCNKGFTIFELLLVLALIAILTGVTIPMVLQSVKLSRIKALVNDMELVSTIVTDYCKVQENQISCELEEVIDFENENTFSKERLGEIIDNDLPLYLSTKVYLSDSSWLTPPGYGAVTVWYPNINENGDRVYYGSIDISKLNYPLKDQKSIRNITNLGNNAMVAFTYDINNNSQLDKEEDFVVLCYYFKLNPQHNHTE